MLKADKNIYCGIFDSSIFRKNEVLSDDREVQFYEIELFHCEGGTSYVGSDRYKTKRGMLLCAKPHQIRHSEFPVRCSFIRVMNDIDDDIVRVLDALPTCKYIEDDDQIERLMGLFAKLGSCFVSNLPRELNDVRINSLFLEILYRCATLRTTQLPTLGDKPVSRVAREAYEYINEHYTESCSLSRISDALCISPNYLHSVFLSDIGITPFEYVTEKRIEHSKQLIMAGEMTMLEIALETGFCSQSHFNKVFKSKTGDTPVQYRKKLLSQY